MSFRFLILLLLFYCCYLATAAKEVTVDGKTYTILPYPEDCQKYMMCNNGNCKLVSCTPTYVFNPATSTCTHQRRAVRCNSNFSKRLYRN